MNQRSKMTIQSIILPSSFSSLQNDTLIMLKVIWMTETNNTESLNCLLNPLIFNTVQQYVQKRKSGETKMFYSLEKNLLLGEIEYIVYISFLPSCEKTPQICDGSLKVLQVQLDKTIKVKLLSELKQTALVPYDKSVSITVCQSKTKTPKLKTKRYFANANVVKSKPSENGSKLELTSILNVVTKNDEGERDLGESTKESLMKHSLKQSPLDQVDLNMGKNIIISEDQSKSGNSDQNTSRRSKRLRLNRNAYHELQKRTQLIANNTSKVSHEELTGLPKSTKNQLASMAQDDNSEQTIDFSQHLFEDDLGGAEYAGDTLYQPGFILGCCSGKLDIQKICIECIKKLCLHHHRVCNSIRRGDCNSRRHDDYKKGGKYRLNLNYQMNCLRVFTDEQQQAVEVWLMKRFCKGGDSRNLDHCLRVLQPELLIRLFMDVTGSTYDEAEIEMLKRA